MKFEVYGFKASIVIEYANEHWNEYLDYLDNWYLDKYNEHTIKTNLEQCLLNYGFMNLNIRWRINGIYWYTNSFIKFSYFS